MSAFVCLLSTTYLMNGQWAYLYIPAWLYLYTPSYILFQCVFFTFRITRSTHPCKRKQFPIFPVHVVDKPLYSPFWLADHFLLIYHKKACGGYHRGSSSFSIRCSWAFCSACTHRHDMTITVHELNIHASAITGKRHRNRIMLFLMRCLSSYNSPLCEYISSVHIIPFSIFKTNSTGIKNGIEKCQPTANARKCLPIFCVYILIPVVN